MDYQYTASATPMYIKSLDVVSILKYFKLAKPADDHLSDPEGTLSSKLPLSVDLFMLYPHRIFLFFHSLILKMGKAVTKMLISWLLTQKAAARIYTEYHYKHLYIISIIIV